MGGLRWGNGRFAGGRRGSGRVISLWACVLAGLAWVRCNDGFDVGSIPTPAGTTSPFSPPTRTTTALLTEKRATRARQACWRLRPRRPKVRSPRQRARRACLKPRRLLRREPQGRRTLRRRGQRKPETIRRKPPETKGRVAPTREQAARILAMAALRALRTKTIRGALRALHRTERRRISMRACAFLLGFGLSENHMRAKVPTLT
jgi:hypothetical protein